MDRHERLSSLLVLLGQRGKVDVDELAGELAVSAATIRRDLDTLAEQQLLTRTRGGAVAQHVAYDLPIRYKSARQAAGRERIARAAGELVERGAVVGLNGGTTTTELARVLAARADLAGRADEPALTVVTNALNIAGELAVRPQVKLVVTGGVARSQSFELTGPLATRILGELAMDVVFLGVNAIDAGGAYARDEGEASVNRMLAERAARVVVVTENAKLDTRAFALICPLSVVDVLITDGDPPAGALAAFEAAGVTVQVV